jgi:hypothetical protein
MTGRYSGEEVQLVRNVNQDAFFYLGVPLCNPVGEAFRVKVRVFLQSRVDIVNDKVQKIFLVGDIPIRASKDYPVRTTCIEQLGTDAAQVSEQVASRPAIARGLSVNRAFIRRSVIERFYERVEVWINHGLQCGHTVEGNR